MNGDGKISLDEAADHLSHKHSGTKRLVKRYATDTEWFSKIDSDDSGFIEAGEFDSDLK